MIVVVEKVRLSVTKSTARKIKAFAEQHGYTFTFRKGDLRDIEDYSRAEEQKAYRILDTVLDGAPWSGM